MKKIFLTALLIFVAGQLVFAQAKVEHQKINISDEELAIYKLVDVRNFRLATIAYAAEDEVYIKREFPDMAPEALADYRAKNDKSYILQWLEKDGEKPKKLKRAEGGARVFFSRIGFNAAKTEAFVYAGFTMASGFCGADYFWLQKKDGVWRIVKRANFLAC